MPQPRRDTRSSSVRYPNQWKAVRQLRGLTQRQVARYLGHLNTKYYSHIERGLRFPGPRILFRLLVLFDVRLRSVYPSLSWQAENAIKRRRERDQPPG